MTHAELTHELLTLSAEVARGEYAIQIDQSRTINDARRAHDVQDRKRVRLAERLKKCYEASRQLEAERKQQ